MIGRYVTGIGTGLETSTVPIYQSELCDAEKRGKLISSEVFFIGLGIVIAYFFDYGMLKKGGDVAWRVPIACQIVFALVSKILFSHSFISVYPDYGRLLLYSSLAFRRARAGCTIMIVTKKHVKCSVTSGIAMPTIRDSSPRSKKFWEPSNLSALTVNTSGRRFSNEMRCKLAAESYWHGACNL